MDNEKGSIVLLSVLITAALSLLAVLAVSHSAYLEDISEAETMANNAARIGAQEVDQLVFLTTNEVQIDPARASTLVAGYIREQSPDGSIRLTGLIVNQNEVRVELTATSSNPISGDKQSTVVGVAQLIQG